MTTIKEKNYDMVFKGYNYYAYDDVIDFKEYLSGYDFSSLLEVGCGNGRNLNYFRNNYDGCRLSGIELSSSGTDFCVDNYLDVVKGSADHLPFKNSSFDAVLCVHSLEQMKYIIDDVLGEIGRVCRRYVFCFEPVFCLQNIMGKFHNFRYDYVKGIPFLLEKHGFDVLVLRNLHIGSFSNRTCLVVGEKR